MSKVVLGNFKRPLTVSGNATIRTAAGQDSISLENATIAKDLTISAGAGNDYIELANSDLNNGAGFVDGPATVRGNVVLELGAATDQGSDGADIVDFGAVSQISPPATVPFTVDGLVDVREADETDVLNYIDLKQQSPWQNPVNPFDNNLDGRVSVVPDVLALVNELNRRALIDAQGRLPATAAVKAFYYDVNGDGLLTPAGDVLPIINFLNRTVLPGASGESAADTLQDLNVSHHPLFGVDYQTDFRSLRRLRKSLERAIDQSLADLSICDLALEDLVTRIIHEQENEPGEHSW